MHILCAPDAFKESITAAGAARAMADGVTRHPGVTADACPVADGGEGTLDTIVTSLGGVVHSARVTGPLGEPVTARYGLVADRDLAVVELAEASGLALVPADQRDPMRTTTFGTGELIRRAAADLPGAGATVLVCIGGSATCDGATGIAQALGMTFYDRDDLPITTPMTGGDLHRIARITPPTPPAAMPRIRICCDVTNPLCGSHGAAATYGPQKGATPEQVERLDHGLAQLARTFNTTPGNTPVNPDTAGSGSAGGAGWGLMALCGGSLERGVDLVLDLVSFDERCRAADLVLTGEGRLDDQSLSGKAALGVAARATRLGRRVIALAGTFGDGYEQCLKPTCPTGLDAAFALTERVDRAQAIGRPEACLADLAHDVISQMRQ